MSTRVLLADADTEFRQGLRQAMARERDVVCVGEAADGRSAVREAESLHPDALVIDFGLPKRGGLWATRAVLARPGNHATVLLLSPCDKEVCVLGGLAAGAAGFLSKKVASEEVARAVRTMASGGVVTDPMTTRMLLDRFVTSREPRPHPELSPRLMQVWLLVANGLSNAEIAAELNIAPNTVKALVQHVLAALGTRDRLQAAVFAYRHRLLTGPVGRY